MKTRENPLQPGQQCLWLGRSGVGRTDLPEHSQHSLMQPHPPAPHAHPLHSDPVTHDHTRVHTHKTLVHGTPGYTHSIFPHVHMHAHVLPTIHSPSQTLSSGTVCPQPHGQGSMCRGNRLSSSPTPGTAFKGWSWLQAAVHCTWQLGTHGVATP